MQLTNCCHCTVKEKIDSGRSAPVAMLSSVAPDAANLRHGVEMASISNCSTGIHFIRFACILLALGCLLSLRAATPLAPNEKAADAPLPAIPQFVREVWQHQIDLDKVRENYTYTSLQTTQDIGTDGQIRKIETVERQELFINGHAIKRTVRKNGSLLGGYQQREEADRVAKLVEKAKKTPPGQPLEMLNTSIIRIPEIVTRMLPVMEVRNPRRVGWHNRPTIAFEFEGRKDAKAHSLAEDISKELKGTIWIDEADRQVAHLEVSFKDDYHLAAGLVAYIEKGSSFHFDQAPVDGELWLPTGGEAAVQARVLIVKTYRQRYCERDYDYKRLRVAEESADRLETAGARRVWEHLWCVPVSGPPVRCSQSPCAGPRITLHYDPYLNQLPTGQ